MAGREPFMCVCWRVKVRPGKAEDVLKEARRSAPRALVQIFSSKSAPNPAAIELIAAQTLRAVDGGEALAEKPEVDLLLRLAATRQIGEAIERSGYKARGRALYMVVAAIGRQPDTTALVEGLGKDPRFARLAPRKLTPGEMDSVERAAILAAGS